jgi:ectoine hydroxylase-related dioxygenase (phytanoyl-CoA dioxygenase family)
MPATVSDERLDVARADFDRDGYCFVENVLTPEELARVRAELVEAADEDVRTGRAMLEYDGANQRVANLLNRGRSFVELAQHPVSVALMEHVLGGGCLLSSLTANITGPGGDAMMLHADQGGIPRPWNYPTVANVMWMIDDFTEENGATRVIPGSHKWDSFDPSAEVETVPVLGKAGSLFAFEGRLIHGTGRNTTTDQRRFGILAYHCLVWCRPQENVFLSLDPQVLAEASPTLLQLLGYTMYGTLPIGMVNGRPWNGSDTGLALGEGLNDGPPVEYGRKPSDARR